MSLTNKSASTCTAAERDDGATTQTHYEAHTASSYEAAFFYSGQGAYSNYLIKLVSNRLGFTETSQNVKDNPSVRRLLDIGGGTGNFTRLLIDGAAMPIEAIVVDPFLSAKQELQPGSSLTFVKAQAESFAIDEDNSNQDSWRQDYDIVLMKEVVHHFDAADRVGIFRGIHKGFSQSDGQPSPITTPNLLIVTRPKHDIDYPLWTEAREVWAVNQPSVQGIEADLKKAGFNNVKHSVESYPCQLPLSKWLDMVQARFWSTFANFSDTELEEACLRIEKDAAKRVDGQGRVHFEDRLLLISASK